MKVTRSARTALSRRLKGTVPWESLRYYKRRRRSQPFRWASLSARAATHGDLDPNLVMYEAYNGRDFSGNPHAMLRYFLSSDEYKHLKHVIAVNEINNPIAQRYEKHPRVRIVEIHSKQYIRAAHTCAVYINNASWKPYIVKRPGQIYVTSWHGTLLKRLGRDAGAPTDTQNVSRALLASDYFLSPNAYTAEHLMRSHGVDGILPGVVAHLGYPRNDFFFLSELERAAIRSRLAVGSKKVVLYAPTWRGSYKPKDTVAQTLNYAEIIEAHAGSDIRVIVKLHPVLHGLIPEGLEERIAPRDLDTNELLAATDILVTDYSGIFFDYLNTGNPIVFLAHDRDQYVKEKGDFYLNLDTLPGPVCDQPEQAGKLAASASDWLQVHADRYKEFRERFTALDDGYSAQRAAELIFRGLHKEACESLQSGRKRLLIYPAKPVGNGVTESFLALLRHLDYDAYDVIVLLPNSRDEKENQARIDPRARVFYQNAPDGFTLREYLKNQRMVSNGARSKADVPVEAFERSITRVFGALDFDVAINFNGYFPNAAAKIGLGVQARRKIIYLHNDLYEDMRIKHPQLHSVFSLYRFYDRLVCVSADSLEANRRSLRPYILQHFGADIFDKMTYAKNLIDVDELRQRASAASTAVVAGQPVLVIDQQDRRRYRAIRFDQSVHNLVVIGRLSPEKNQARVLRALSKALPICPSLHLYIVGRGPQRRALGALVRELGLDEFVTFVGFMRNPLPLVERCDNLISGSDIEGQPITMLEALVLGTDIIATDIEGPRGLLEGGLGGRLTPVSSDGLAAGIVQEYNLLGTAISGRFSAESYVQDALADFYRLLD